MNIHCALDSSPTLFWVTPQNEPFWGTDSCQPLCRVMRQQVERCAWPSPWELGPKVLGCLHEKGQQELGGDLGPGWQLLVQAAASHSVWVAVSLHISQARKFSHPRDILTAKSTRSTPTKMSHCEELMSHLKYSHMKWWCLLADNELNKIQAIKCSLRCFATFAGVGAQR